MGDLLAARYRSGEFIPFTGRGKPAEIEKAAAVQGGVGNPHDSSQAEQRLLIDFISAHQIGVIAEIPQEPAEFPKRFGSAVETTGQRTALTLSWFENSEPQNIERSLRMPAVEGPIDADQENSLQNVLSGAGFAMQTLDMALRYL